MTLPVPGQPGETPEQRQARFAAADAIQARIDAERRAASEPRGTPAPIGIPILQAPMPIGTPIAQQRPDPGFDINVAFNTMNKRLGELVNSGQMSLDQARAAQSEMRALQLNPAAANRQAATDIAQRHLQVGKYSPSQPQGGLTLAQPQGVGGMGQSVNPVTPPQEIMVTAQRPPMPEIVMPPMLKQFPQLPQGVGGMPQQGSPNSLTIARGPVPLNQRGPGLGGGIGAFLGKQGETPQGGGMPPGVGMLRGQIDAMLKARQPQSSFVDTMPKAIVDDNFRFGETTQQMPQNAQAMAMGGLLRKYYGGGMC